MAWTTHGVAVCVGWAVWSGGGFSSSQVSEESSAPSNMRTQSRDRSSTGAGAEAEVRELLVSLRAEVKKSAAMEKAGRDGSGIDPKLFSRIDSIEVPDDIRKALEDLLAKIDAGEISQEDRAEMLALAYHWLKRDSNGLFAYLAEVPSARPMLEGVLAGLAPEIYRRDGIEYALVVLSEMRGAAAYAARNLGTVVGAKADVAAVTSGRRYLTEDQKRIGFVRAVGEAWPVGKMDALVRLAVEIDAPRLLLDVKSGEAGRAAFFASLLANQSLPETFRDFFRNESDVRSAFLLDPSMPMDLRLQMGADASSLASIDIAGVFEKRDWPFAIRRGEATAEEVWAAVAAASPELVAKEPDVVRRYLFGELAEEDPVAAMALLKDQTEEQRNATILLATRTHFENIEPDKFVEMLQQVPSDTPETWNGRLDAWNLRSFTNFNRLHDGYVEWVEKMPPGLDRDMALYSLARAVPDGALASRLRAQVGDPELKQRIATHQ